MQRTTVYELWSGFEIYQLTAPDGTAYVMQAMSQIVDEDLAIEDLADLGSRLELPDGWTYEARLLITDLVLEAEGEATVIQDELENTYQRTDGVGGSSDTLPVLDNGTGTLCSSEADCEELDASHCLALGGQGFCTIEGCASGQCGAPYVCCSDCNPAAAPMLPFEGSACLPEAATGVLANQAGCTCE